MIYFKQKASSSGGGGSSLLNKLDATSAPTVNDDSGDGYSVGSLWIDVSAKEAYRCVDATVGAAVWLNTTVEITDLGDIVTRDADEFAGADHNHDEAYSAIGHDHDEDYADLVHTHSEKADKVVVDEYDEYDAPEGYVATFDADGNLDLSDKKVSEVVTSTTIQLIVTLTQAEYDLLSPPDSATLYVIVEEEE